MIEKFKETARVYLADYQVQMERNGFKPIGHGIAGTVYEHPTNPKVVVKVTTGKADDADIKWLRWCKQNRNPWAVKVLKIKPLPTKEPAFAIYMERLEPATKQQVDNALQYSGAAGRSIGACLYPKGTHWRFVPDFNGDTSRVANKDIGEVLGVIYKLTRKVNGRLKGTTDMKPDNFLLRGTQVVFVDPIA